MNKKQTRIYTKGGDKGKTSLVGGTRVPKNHDRIEAYGTLDELNSYIGLLRDSLKDENQRKVLKEIQENVFVIESYLATEDKEIASTLPSLSKNAIEKLENQIDRMTETLPELKHFILPGGDPVISYTHIARTVCRRAERRAISLTEQYEIEPMLLQYLNRLSDYFFTLGRFLCKELNLNEYYWKPTD